MSQKPQVHQATGYQSSEQGEGLSVRVVDQHLCFVFTFSHLDGWVLIKRLVEQIKLFHPFSIVVAISDGNCTPELQNFLEAEKIILVQGSPLKTRRHGGEWILRIFEQFAINAGSSARYLVKTEPDTSLEGRIEEVPAGDVIGNLVYQGTEGELVRGGLQIFSRNFVLKALQEKIFSHSKWQDPKWCYRRLNHWKHPWEGKNNSLFICADRIIAAAVKELGFELTHWRRLEAIQFRDFVPDVNSNRFLARHPVFDGVDHAVYQSCSTNEGKKFTEINWIYRNINKCPGLIVIIGRNPLPISFIYAAKKRGMTTMVIIQTGVDEEPRITPYIPLVNYAANIVKTRVPITISNVGFLFFDDRTFSYADEKAWLSRIKLNDGALVAGFQPYPENLFSIWARRVRLTTHDPI